MGTYTPDYRWDVTSTEAYAADAAAAKYTARYIPVEHVADADADAADACTPDPFADVRRAAYFYPVRGHVTYDDGAPTRTDVRAARRCKAKHAYAPLRCGCRYF